jgi:hypothetical protein
VSSPKHAALTRQIQERIGQQLRAMYNDVVSQGIPDRFTDLLKRLDERGPADLEQQRDEDKA